jgi:hypothetical protein
MYPSERQISSLVDCGWGDVFHNNASATPLAPRGGTGSVDVTGSVPNADTACHALPVSPQKLGVDRLRVVDS